MTTAVPTGSSRSAASWRSPHPPITSTSRRNFDTQPLASLSQTFATVVGGLYTVSFYFDPLPGVNSDPNAFLRVSAGNGSVTLLYDTAASLFNYSLGSFSFFGTGSDTLTIAAQTNRNAWLVDDGSVIGGAVPTPPPIPAAVLEPATWAMMLVGFGMMGATMRYRRRSTKAVYA